jgi:WD40 repeat protein
VPERVSVFLNYSFSFLILSTPSTQEGDIFVWDTESGALLHHIRRQSHNADITCLAWNHAASDPFLFATGSHNGTVRIWTKPPNSPDYVPEDLDNHDHTPGPHLGDGDYFTFGDMPRSSSPHGSDLPPLVGEPGREAPDQPEYPRRVKKGLPTVSSKSSESSFNVKMR